MAIIVSVTSDRLGISSEEEHSKCGRAWGLPLEDVERSS
jgi:hypothetical protein